MKNPVTGTYYQLFVFVQNVNEVDEKKCHDVPRHHVQKVRCTCLKPSLSLERRKFVTFFESWTILHLPPPLKNFDNNVVARWWKTQTGAPGVQVICSLCDCEQDVKQVCENCGVCMGAYYCDKCKFFDDEVCILPNLNTTSYQELHKWAISPFLVKDA